MKALLIGMLVTTLIAPVEPVEKRYSDYSTDGVYDVWASPGLHLVMSDNSTPDDYDDDWVIDYETNRDIVVTVLDK